MKKISISTLIICLLILILPLIVGAQYDESCGDRCMDDPNYNECVNNCAKDMQEQEGGTIGNFKYNIPIGGNTDFNITESNKGRILGDFFNIWYGMLMGAIGVVATFMIAWGGFQYLSSRGDSTQIGNAKNTIISAITGLILAFTSYLILSVISPNLLEFKDLNLTTVEGVASDPSVGSGEGGHFNPDGTPNLHPAPTDGLTPETNSLKDFINEATGSQPSSAKRPNDNGSEHEKGRALDYPRNDNTDDFFGALIEEAGKPIANHKGWPIYILRDKRIGGVTYPVIRIIDEFNKVDGEGNCYHIDQGKFGQDY